MDGLILTYYLKSYLYIFLGFKKVFTAISRLAGLILLPVGLYATYEFTFQSASDPLPIYIYAQTIHVSEILTGLLTVFLLVSLKE